MGNCLARALACVALLLVGAAQATSPAGTVAPLSPPRPQTGREATPPPLAEPGSQDTRTVLLLGDSLLTTSFGEHLQNRLEAHPRIRCARRAKTSSGLARPDFFDWMEIGRQEVQRHQPDLVVVILGGNDGQWLMDREGRAQVSWGEPGWEQAYRQRVEAFLQVLAAPHRKVFWLELPRMELQSFERKLVLIRRLQREVLATRADAVHLDTGRFFTDAKGATLRHAEVEGFRKPKRLRLDDGVHFTIAGGRYFANKVYPEVLGMLGVAPPERKRGTASTAGSPRANTSKPRGKQVATSKPPAPQEGAPAPLRKDVGS